MQCYLYVIWKKQIDLLYSLDPLFSPFRQGELRILRILILKLSVKRNTNNMLKLQTIITIIKNHLLSSSIILECFRHKNLSRAFSWSAMLVSWCRFGLDDKLLQNEFLVRRLLKFDYSYFKYFFSEHPA